MTASAPESPSRRPRRPFQRYVRVLSALAALLALAIVATGYLKLGVPSGAGEDAEAARDRQRIEKPVYTTRLANGALLTFSADFAIPLEIRPSVVALYGVSIDGKSQDGRPFSARSNQGTLRIDEGLLVLLGDVTSRGPAGERFSGTGVTLETREGRIRSETPVRIVWGPVELEAGDMRVEDRGEGLQAWFSKGVRMVYRAPDRGG